MCASLAHISTRDYTQETLIGRPMFWAPDTKACPPILRDVFFQFHVEERLSA